MTTHQRGVSKRAVRRQLQETHRNNQKREFCRLQAGKKNAGHDLLNSTERPHSSPFHGTLHSPVEVTASAQLPLLAYRALLAPQEVLDLLQLPLLDHLRLLRRELIREALDLVVTDATRPKRWPDLFKHIARGQSNVTVSTILCIPKSTHPTPTHTHTQTQTSHTHKPPLTHLLRHVFQLKLRVVLAGKPLQQDGYEQGHDDVRAENDYDDEVDDGEDAVVGVQVRL